MVFKFEFLKSSEDKSAHKARNSLVDVSHSLSTLDTVEPGPTKSGISCVIYI